MNTKKTDKSKKKKLLNFSSKKRNMSRVYANFHKMAAGDRYQLPMTQKAEMGKENKGMED